MIWSAIEPPSGRILWVAEALPFFVGLIILTGTYRAFPLTVFTYNSIIVSSILVLTGAHFSYAHVPLGDWFKTNCGFTRNNYDKIGHFFQGYTIAVLTKEIVIRKHIVSSKSWINLFSISMAVALSAVYEIIEWFTVVILVFFGSKEPATGFMGTQNYTWDSQSDIFFAAVGAAVVIYLLGRYHENAIQSLLNHGKNIPGK